ncbi:deoxyguanosinetriphosphate triphosphohydrolase family protein [Heliorestis convoluta]|uniref:Putative dGTPase n=1 Tax=Heliorestis convoluta TaxID=356322 RepID=A0A5Q2N131_9FIRM|nr:putative dGTPase [Heliorestis convoluta]
MLCQNGSNKNSVVSFGCLSEQDKQYCTEQRNLASYRSKFMQDRDRVLYSRPFLRLAGKTQVYGTGYDDHARNRLTHSLEVAQISKTIASALNLEYGSIIKIDLDLVEAIALGHDIGHTPFGHAGERKLDEILNYEDEDINKRLELPSSPCIDLISIMDKNRGFKHNWQSVRIVNDLSRDFYDFNMELSSITVSGILFHSSLKFTKREEPPQFYLDRYKKQIIVNQGNYVWSLEGLIVEIADEIAQRHHDIEDAISCHYLTPKKVIELLKNSLDELEKRDEKFKNKEIPDGFNNILDEILKANDSSEKELEEYKDTDIFLRQISKYIVNWLVADCVQTTAEQLKEVIKDSEIRDMNIIDDKYEYERRIKKDIVKLSPKTAFADKLLQYRLKKVVLNSRNVQRMDNRGSFIIRKLVLAYITSPQQMPDKTIFSLFREYVKNFYNEHMSEIEKECNRYLFKDAADARNALDYCLNDEKSTEIIFSKEHKVSLDKTKFKLSLLRVIADYIAGMTDSYAEKEYRKLYAIDHDIEA